MRRARIALFPALVVGLISSFSSMASAQTRDRFIISATAGGVNAVTGRASMRSHDGSEWQLLTIKEDLQTGDVVKTGQDGRVEVLLNPGSYFRLGENSEFELSNNSLANLEVKLIRGTAIVEATGADDTALMINITTPHARIALIRRGLYRLNVVPGDNTELIVRKGRAMHEKSQTRIDGGNKVVFSAATFSIAKLQKAEKKNFDSLEIWSKERAETVALANKKIRGRDLNLFMSSSAYRWHQMFSASNAGGFWFFNGLYNCYTFMPFYNGWGSPYGGSYSRSFYGFYNCCGGRQYYRPDAYNNRQPRSGNASNNPPPSNSPPGNPGGMPSPLPTYTPMEPRQIPAAAERHIERNSERLPNP